MCAAVNADEDQSCITSWCWQAAEGEEAWETAGQRWQYAEHREQSPAAASSGGDGWWQELKYWNRDHDCNRQRHGRNSRSPGDRSLSSRQGRRPEEEQKPRGKSEWWCHHSQMSNFFDRSSCRECGTPPSGHDALRLGTEDTLTSQQLGASSGAEEAASPATSDEGSSPARSPSPRKAALLTPRAITAHSFSDAERARALEQQSRLIKAANGDERIVAMLEAEAKEAWLAHRSRRPTGERLDSARVACATAEKELTMAAEAVCKALEQHKAAEHKLKRATQEYEEERAREAIVSARAYAREAAAAAAARRAAPSTRATPRPREKSRSSRGRRRGAGS